MRADTVQRTIGERPDHGRPAMASSGKKRSWNLHIGDRSRRIATESHGAVLSRFAFTSDGSLMAAVGHSPDIEIWDVDQAERIAVLRPDRAPVGHASA
ncbi:hypothetical protein [Streptomyces olivaceoviridis]|uniref:hypothetical protein n=1 Tax=Streptomyces olivaceoviridis TaxID=1921 RepID=UPI0037A9EAF4